MEKKRTFLSDGYAGRTNEREALDQRYSKIGISAVAAAVRYSGEAKASRGSGIRNQPIRDQAAGTSFDR